MTQLTEKAKVILNWLNDPTSKRYIAGLLEDEKNLSKLALVAMQQAITDGLIQRSQDEIKVFSELKATKILLSKIPYEISRKDNRAEELTEEEIKELDNFFEQLPN